MALPRAAQSHCSRPVAGGGRRDNQKRKGRHFGGRRRFRFRMSQQPSTTSLLSLSIAAASAQPIPLPGPSTKHHRRLSSTGKTRRRLSDARDAANRPTYHFLLFTFFLVAVVLTRNPGLQLPQRCHWLLCPSLRLLPLQPTISPPPLVLPLTLLSVPLRREASPKHSNLSLPTMPPTPAAFLPTLLRPYQLQMERTGNEAQTTNARAVQRHVPVFGFLLPSCLRLEQIYRHPSCLIKHRWEHTPHWREASKYVLSKHQQVQLLEVSQVFYLLLCTFF